MVNTVGNQSSIENLNAIRVAESYNAIFRQKLRKFLKVDFEEFTGGMPSYHKHLTRVVTKYAGNKVNVDGISKETLRNFIFSEMNSYASAVAVLDAYVQISRPDIHRKFLPNAYLKSICETFEEYLEDTNLKPYERKLIIKEIIGHYRLIENASIPPSRITGLPRYLVIKRSYSNRFLFCYEFNTNLETPLHIEADEEYKLVTGLCIPSVNSLLLIMRDFRYFSRRLGHVINYRYRFDENEGRNTDPHLVVNYALTDEGGYNWRSVYKNYDRTTNDVGDSSSLIYYCANKIKEKAHIERLSKLIENFGDVF